MAKRSVQYGGRILGGLVLLAGFARTVDLCFDDDTRHANGGVYSLGLPMVVMAIGLGVASFSVRSVRPWKNDTLESTPVWVTVLATCGVFGSLLLAGLGVLVRLSGPVSHYTSSHGRRFFRRGRARVAGTMQGTAWVGAQPLEPTLAEDRDAANAVAQEWRKTAAKEHASIPSFGQLALDLLTVGAPPSLLSAAHRDALDEIRHAETCYAVAKGFDGRAGGPAPFAAARALRSLPASRAAALVRIARDTLLDGAINEAYSARVLARLAERVADVSLAESLRAMAADESRHATDSWTIVSWCVETSRAIGSKEGAAIERTLARVMGSVPAIVASDVPVVARDGRWERFGIQGRALEEAEYEKTLHHAKLRLAALLRAPSRPREAGDAGSFAARSVSTLRAA